MPKLPKRSSKKVLSALLRAGFFVHHQTGSHVNLRHESKTHLRLVIPMHSGELSPKTLKSIINQSGMSQTQFIELLLQSGGAKETLPEILPRHGCVKGQHSRHRPRPLRRPPAYRGPQRRTHLGRAPKQSNACDGVNPRARTRAPPSRSNSRWRRNFPHKHSHIMQNVRMPNEQKDVGKTLEPNGGRITALCFGKNGRIG